MRAATCCVLVLVATVAATALRAPRLEQRPMHTDEAVHAYKFGELLEENTYHYDPFEYHGPTLNYFTLIPALLRGAHSHNTLTEPLLRSVPVGFGLLLILLLLPLRMDLGPTPSFCAATLTAVSPSMVFYSRYYIMEILLVCFTFGVIVGGVRYLRTKKTAWAIFTGACLGLMHATKETCVIAYACLGAGLISVALLQSRQGRPLADQIKSINWPQLGLLTTTAILVSASFFSSFGTHSTGIWDSIRTYATYLDRAGHSPHEHPWHYYLGILSYYQFADGPVFTEILILALSLVGCMVAIAGKGLPGTNYTLARFLVIYTLLMTALYSFISYKTPWCLLGFLHGMILLAGLGASRLLQLKSKPLRLGFTLLMVLGAGHLAIQSVNASFRFDSDSRNPHVYAHTSKDILEIVERVKAMAEAHPDGASTPIQVTCPNGDYWPLPWYLRGYQVEYTSEIDTNSPVAPIVLIQPPVEEDLMVKLYEIPPPGQREMYMYLFYENGALQYRELRPQVELRGYVSKQLWDLHEQAESKTDLPAPAPPNKDNTPAP